MVTGEIDRHLRFCLNGYVRNVCPVFMHLSVSHLVRKICFFVVKCRHSVDQMKQRYHYNGYPVIMCCFWVLLI